MIARFIRLLTAIVVITVTITACAPSLPYIMGNGFYEKFSKAQVQAAANNGKVNFLGKFSEDSTACGNFTQDIADNNLVIAVAKSQLAKSSGNAADNIVAKWNLADFILAVTLIPGLAGCRSYTISGETPFATATCQTALEGSSCIFPFDSRIHTLSCFLF